MNNNVHSVVVQCPLSQNYYSSSNQGQRWDKNLVFNILCLSQDFVIFVKSPVQGLKQTKVRVNMLVVGMQRERENNCIFATSEEKYPKNLNEYICSHDMCLKINR